MRAMSGVSTKGSSDRRYRGLVSNGARRPKPKTSQGGNLKHGTGRKSKGHMEEARKIAEGTADWFRVKFGKELDGVPKDPATSLKLVGNSQELHCRNLGAK